MHVNLESMSNGVPTLSLETEEHNSNMKGIKNEQASKVIKIFMHMP